MPLHVYLSFVAASVALILLPGPNMAVIVATSAAHGVRAGLAAVAGVSAAMALQLAIVVGGLTGVLALASKAIGVLRWVGVAYLFYLGISSWRATDTAAGPSSASFPQMFQRGFVVALTNPKTLLFYAAFLPQFVSDAEEPLPELLLLAATFLGLALVFDSTWAFLADRVQRLLGHDSVIVKRVTGGILLAAAAAIALARAPV